MSTLRICFLFFLASCALYAAPLSATSVPGESKIYSRIYLVNHGWHAGIVLRHDAIPQDSWPISGDFPDAEYLEVGWGDLDFYRTPNAHIGITLKAALLPSASVLHIVGFSGPVTTHFPASEIIELAVARDGLSDLVLLIGESFSRDDAGKPLFLGRGLYGNSRFYQSHETYHLFNNCNVWTARALLAGGIPITPLGAQTVDELMSQAREIGVLIQQQPDSRR